MQQTLSIQNGKVWSVVGLSVQETNKTSYSVLLKKYKLYI